MDLYTLVTGATSDIGKEICRTLEKSGHNILLTDVSQEQLLAFAATLERPNQHLVLALDLSDVTGCKETLSNFVIEEQISVGYAVFAAGIFAVKPLKMIDYDFLKKSFDIALFSMFAIMQVLVAKKINAKNLKNVVVISSVNAKLGTKGYAVYGSVKSAMLGFVKSMAVELSPTVRVNAVLPGAIRTRTTNFLYEAQEGEINPRYLLGEGQCGDVANAINFLLSDNSRWITGQEFIVDGGLTIG